MRRLLLIEDDDTTREVLTLLLQEDGWEVTGAANGDTGLCLARDLQPEVVLSDLQIPGTSGTTLAQALRGQLGDEPALLAMTATRLANAPVGFDALLIKPFDAEAVRNALRGARPFDAHRSSSMEPVLEDDTFARLQASMPAAQLRALYDFALQDADRRIAAMEATTEDEVFRREAHALKGSCAMVGAPRLRKFAMVAEETGLPQTSMQSKLFSDFREEVEQLRRMLEKHLP